MTAEIPDWSQNMFGEPIPVSDYAALAADNRKQRLAEAPEPATTNSDESEGSPTHTLDRTLVPGWTAVISPDGKNRFWVMQQESTEGADN